MYLRLVVTRRDEESARKQGVFTPAYTLLRGRTLPAEEHERLADAVRWFERYLPAPDRSKLEPASIFWFRPDSGWLIRKIWEIVDILRQNDFHVELLKTSRPGYVRYSDPFQVAAKPFRDSRIG